VKRKAVKIRSSTDGKRDIYIDEDNAPNILAYIKQDARHEKKFTFITDIILEGLRNTEVYDKEDFNQKCKNVTAMKLFKGQENDRIYCQEITKDDRTFVVIVSELHEKKKSQSLSHKEKALIEKVASYEYELNE
jgi:hypothetical protein